MAKITDELVYEILKDIQRRMSNLEEGQRDLREQFNSMRGMMHSMQGDVHNLYVSQEAIRRRIDRIEERLQLSDDAAE